MSTNSLGTNKQIDNPILIIICRLSVKY